MIIIRLQRIGRKNEAHFRLIATDSKNSAKTGKFLEVVGTYNPHSKALTVKKDRIDSYIKNGAQASDTVHNLFVKNGMKEGKKKNVLPKKAPTKPRKEAKK